MVKVICNMTPMMMMVTAIAELLNFIYFDGVCQLFHEKHRFTCAVRAPLANPECANIATEY